MSGHENNALGIRQWAVDPNPVWIHNPQPVGDLFATLDLEVLPPLVPVLTLAVPMDGCGGDDPDGGFLMTGLE